MRVEVLETELKAWPYSVRLVPGPEFSNVMAVFWSTTHRNITTWLILNDIKHEYANGLFWYLKTQEDAAFFALRWA